MWDFPTIGLLPPEQLQRWLDVCYVPSNIDALFADADRSVVALTSAGCGLTTSLALLPSYGFLSFSYNPEDWPGQPNAFTTHGDHFSQWMARIATSFTDQLRLNEAILLELPQSQHEFLIWMQRHYLGARQGRNWLEYVRTRLHPDTWNQLNEVVIQPEFETLYGAAVGDLYGQIDECLIIAERLGWRGIYASIDISWSYWFDQNAEARRKFVEDVKRLLTTLTPLQRPRFGIKMGLPRQMVSPQEVKAWVRGRVTVRAYEWSASELQHITAKLLALPVEQASDEHTYHSELLWQHFAPDIISIWGAPVPSASVVLAQLGAQLQTTSLDKTHFMALRYQLYSQVALLRLDPDHTQHVVWRGMTRIILDETPYRFFKVLWHHRGAFASNETLLDVATTKTNLDKIVQRLREAIEPFYKEKEKRFIYIERNSASGTRLVKDSCIFS